MKLMDNFNFCFFIRTFANYKSALNHMKGTSTNPTLDSKHGY